MFGRQNISHLLTEKRLGRRLQETRIASIVIKILTLQTLQKHHVWQSSQDGLIATVNFRQGLVRNLSISDVSDISQKMNRLPLIVFDDRTINVNPHGVAVLVNVSLFEIERLYLATNQALALAPVNVDIVRVRDVHEPSCQELSLGISNQITQGLRDLQPPSL